MNTIRKIKSITIIPPTTIIKAVYFHEKSNTLSRIPIVFAAIVDGGNNIDRLELWDQSIEGVFADCKRCINFIGYEYNGEAKNWDNEIEKKKTNK